MIFAGATGAFAAEQKGTPSIVDKIMADSASIVVQPGGLSERVLFHKPEVRQRPVNNRMGYRVQIFSDGNQTTARNTARARIRQVSSRFPQYRTYLDYKAPYWRARVGDFKSKEEANELSGQIRRAFPAFSSEVRVVSDRISIIEQPTE